MTTFTDRLRLDRQATGSNPNTWGQVLNKTLALADFAIAGTARVVLAGNDYELTVANGADDEARAAVLDLQGQPSDAVNVIVPAVSKVYLVRNNTTGERAITLRTRLGQGVAVPPGSARWLYCDGADVLFAATAEDTRLVAGRVPGDAVARDVGARDDDGHYRDAALLDVAALDQRYVNQSGISAVGNFTTGDVKPTYKKQEVGWVRMNNGSIGPANSGATARANSDCEALYTLLWNNVDDDDAPVSGGRGASAAIDWDARKALKLPLTTARALAAAGELVDGARHRLGSTYGEEDHKQTIEEMPKHRHDLPNEKASDDGDGADGVGDATYGNNQTDYAGGDQPFNVTGPRAYVNYLIKL